MLLKKSKRLAYRVIDGEGFVVDTKSQVLHHLNPTAAQVWQWLDGTRTPEDLAKLLAQEFEVETETARRDVQDLLNDLKSHRLVEESSS